MPKQPGKLSRRQVMRRGAAGAAGLAAASFAGPVWAAKNGANERIRIAVAGIKGRGESHNRAFSEMDDVTIEYLVDPDMRLFESRSRSVEDRAGNRPQCVQDIRRVLSDKSIDAISIATPNHWHSLMTIWACLAG
jgi:predicted dehydrogenase